MKYSQKPKQNRTRQKQIIFRVTEEEHELIKRKMRQTGTTNISRYMRKMAIDGYVIETDYSDLKETCYQMQKIGTNINQIARRINTANANSIQQREMELIQESVEKIWQLLRSNLSKCG